MMMVMMIIHVLLLLNNSLCPFFILKKHCDVSVDITHCDKLQNRIIIIIIKSNSLLVMVTERI